MGWYLGTRGTNNTYMGCLSRSFWNHLVHVSQKSMMQHLYDTFICYTCTIAVAKQMIKDHGSLVCWLKSCVIYKEWSAYTCRKREFILMCLKYVKLNLLKAQVEINLKWQIVHYWNPITYYFCVQAFLVETESDVKEFIAQTPISCHWNYKFYSAGG